ncbi:hypothetical protein HZH66_006508 [Vespula vulgaris]|uniref:Uncharacterized protein n=1 Tax=Vespula vulgaris TaxID=7454 RepID=A0A834K780_VESVU|nr:hypothetical protein HZH66_006508 [Vespula vulgaris]
MVDNRCDCTADSRVIEGIQFARSRKERYCTEKIEAWLISAGLLQVNRRGKEGSKEVQRGVLLSSEEFAMSDRAKGKKYIWRCETSRLRASEGLYINELSRLEEEDNDDDHDDDDDDDDDDDEDDGDDE